MSFNNNNNCNNNNNNNTDIFNSPLPEDTKRRETLKKNKENTNEGKNKTTEKGC